MMTGRFSSRVAAMHVTRTIFLIGPRACGKTSVGRALADRLGLDFVDTDHALVEAAGTAIADYVAARGWDAFRDLEAATLARVARGPVRVVGCGGGIVLRPENRAVLADGVVLYLETAPETLAARLLADPIAAQRPSLTGGGVADEVRQVLAERAPLYAASADIVLHEAPLADVVEEALCAIERFFEHF